MKNLTKRLMLFTLLFLFCFSVSAVEVDFDIGVTIYQPAPIGNWYQSNMPYTLRTNALTGSIGVYTDKTSLPFLSGYSLFKDLQFGISIGNTGRATSDAMIHDVDNCSVNCGPVSHMQGQGTEPYVTFNGRKWLGDNWFTEAGLCVYRPNYANDNFDWYNWQTGAGPVVSHIDHQVINTYGLDVAIGYAIENKVRVVFKLIPTKSTNANTTEGISGNYYRPITAGAFGYSPVITLQIPFNL